MLANYGYKDATGGFFIIIDTDKCDGCGKCIEACPANILEVGPDEVDPFREGLVVKVTEPERNKIKYACAPCKPSRRVRELPCQSACEARAITHTW